jgi:hypothetical protein
MEVYCGIGGTISLVLNLGERLSGQLRALAGVPLAKESLAFTEHKFEWVP